MTSGIVSALNRPVVTQQEQPQQTPRGGFGGLSGLGSFGSLGGSGGGEPAAPLPSLLLDAHPDRRRDQPGHPVVHLVDMQGRIVGLNSAIASLDSAQSGGRSGSIGLGFSIPINQAKRIADQLIATGHAEQAQLGVNIKDGSPTGAQVAGKPARPQPRRATARRPDHEGQHPTDQGRRRAERGDQLAGAEYPGDLDRDQWRGRTAQRAGHPGERDRLLATT